MDFTGLYGRGTGFPGRQMAEETASAEASGPPMANAKPAMFWLAIVVILIVTRLLWEYAA